VELICGYISSGGTWLGRRCKHNVLMGMDFCVVVVGRRFGRVMLLWVCARNWH